METPPLDLALVLSLHTPYVAAPHRRSGETNAMGDALWAWVSESLVPLLNVIERLEREQVEAPLSLAISPLACEMLADIEAAPAYLKYLERQAEAARTHAQLFAERGQEMQRDGCAFWEAWYQDAERDFSDRYAQDLLGALRDFQSRERIELLATPATLAPLPLLALGSSVQAQLDLAVETFNKYFGRTPRGLWTCHGLEAPGAPGIAVARPIAAAGFEYVIEGAPTTWAQETGQDGGTRYEMERLPWLRGVLLPIEREGLPGGDFAPRLEGALLRLRPHAAASEQAWHAAGYAGEERFLCSMRRQQPGALRLWRNTAEGTPLSRLEPYEPLGTPLVCEAQAAHWLDRLSEWAGESGQRRPCVALDAALLGARWFEGHAWLARALKHASTDARFQLRFASHALTLGCLDSLAVAGEPDAAGASRLANEGPTLWRNERSAQMWAEVHECEGVLQEWARAQAGTPNPKLREILNQCARELLLIQSGDWPLLLAALPPQPEREDDARSQLAAHLESFRGLIAIAATVERGEFMSEGQRAFLDDLLARDDLFPAASFTAWAST